MHYVYCPQCGMKLTDKSAGDDGYVPFCKQCRKYWFDSFPSCSIVLVANQYKTAGHSISLGAVTKYLFEVAAQLYDRHFGITQLFQSV